MAEHKHLAEQDVELVELRLDFIRRAVNLKRLLKDRHCPVIATCRRKEDGGRWEHSEEDRVMFCLLYTSPSPRDKRQSRMPSSA